MRKNIILLLVFTIPFLSQAQDIQLVTIKGDVTDFKDKAREGEQILFVNESGDNEYKAVSNSNGKFEIRIPGPDTYFIKIKGVGMEQDYQKFTIPKLKPNQMYGDFEMTIKFEPPRLFTLDNVFFDTGKATLRPESVKELTELQEYLELKPEIRVEIAGHTDNVGSDESNLTLSQNRAESVKRWLVSKGIKSSRIVAKGYGETKPRASNETDEGRQKNRRTEVKILE